MEARADPPAGSTIHERSHPMFPEYRELISQLKHQDRHFQNLFDQHNTLDQQIQNMEKHIVPGTPEEIETLKKQKLHLKDQLYQVLAKASAKP
jgi:uncharacterized protein YdcH (DUF465 family)